MSDAISNMFKFFNKTPAEEKSPAAEKESLDRDKMKNAIAQLIADKLSGQKEESLRQVFDREYLTTPAEDPSVKRFKFVGKLGWAWEVENSASNDEINDLLSKHSESVELAATMATNLFREVAERAGASTESSYIDEEGTNLALPSVPYSPYSDQGAAFFISLAYNWRSMAEQWNEQEQGRIKKQDAERMAREMADKDRQQAELAQYMKEHSDKMIRDMLLKGEITKYPERDDALDARAMIVSTPTTSGIDKIAAALARGELPESKYK